MKEILETMITSLVEDKDAVEINETENENQTVYEIKVAQSDMGRVIGRQGRIARAIRTVIKSIANKDHKKVTVEFVEK